VRKQEDVSSLGPPTIHFLKAAQGWLELGNAVEAAAELKRIPTEYSEHAEVLEVHWEIFSQQKRWEDAKAVSDCLVAHHPKLPSGWIGRSYSLHELGRTSEALQSLLPAFDAFPNVAVIPYNLACYNCQLGQTEEAMAWIRKAVSRAGLDSIKSMAAGDRDLAPLRDWIRTLSV
jgi:tetratricopeptide (TPR) repeat protein